MTYYINDCDALREMSDRKKHPPIGAWFNPAPGKWSQLRMRMRGGLKDFEWVDVPQEQLPPVMRVRMLLIGVQ